MDLVRGPLPFSQPLRLRYAVIGQKEKSVRTTPLEGLTTGTNLNQIFPISRTIDEYVVVGPLTKTGLGRKFCKE